MKLGSLFDGIGGFPLVASWYGITPVWASEIVSECVSITRRHFPNMTHLGDITKINGAEIEPADIITFGSPCQDLSVAGKRAGLAGERSGLFGEAIRIIEEMREATNNEYPTFAVWENVPGALSSNKGLDFRSVLQAFADCEIPMPESGRWATAGIVRGGKCDVAWRILDAQHWGVPQRRRRIFLVADFGGQRSAEVLFKPESLRGDFKTCRAPGEETARSVAGGIGSAAGFNGWRSVTGTVEYQEECAPCLYENHAQDSRVTGPLKVSPTISQKWGTGGGNTPIVCMSDTQGHATVDVDLCPTLNCMHEQPYIVKAYTLDCRNLAGNEELSGTLQAKSGSGYSLNYINPVLLKQIIRRLTPIECERLQGFPDGWTSRGHDGKSISDSARYRALGNSVALPCVEYVLGGIAEVLLCETE